MHLRVGELSCLFQFRFPCPHHFRSSSFTMPSSPHSLPSCSLFRFLPPLPSAFCPLCPSFWGVFILGLPRPFVTPCFKPFADKFGWRCLGERSPFFLLFGSWSNYCVGVVLGPSVVPLSISVCWASPRGWDLGRKAFNLFAPHFRRFPAPQCSME